MASGIDWEILEAELQGPAQRDVASGSGSSAKAPAHWSAARSSKRFEMHSAIADSAAQGSAGHNVKPKARSQVEEAAVSIPFYLERAELCPRRRTGEAQFVVAEPADMLLFTR
ncbi:unnamed protein product [Polarella glacialis]|uniref:Uncharacterized protein n=1 Tax=Polarella glacialis TaxID=89957 RepID=A0A813K4C4_POLGL|nr:unnamed protein product [Polarella glacialis]